MNKNPASKTIVIGADEIGIAESADIDKSDIHKTNHLYWNTNGNDYLGAIVLPLYGPFITEEKCKLFDDVTGKKVLEIGCGNGHSLKYHADRKASELWGIDISENQIKKAMQYLTSYGYSAKLICSPMEEDCGLPQNYFDYVYSIYAIGWTTDLEGTFRRIASYLKRDGLFIFSWSHPIHRCVVAENNMLAFKKSYFDESWYSMNLEGSELTLSDRKLSTYVNALAKAGFIIIPRSAI